MQHSKNSQAWALKLFLFPAQGMWISEVSFLITPVHTDFLMETSQIYGLSQDLEIAAP